MRTVILETELSGPDYEVYVTLRGDEHRHPTYITVDGVWEGLYDRSVSVYPKGLLWACSWFADEMGDSDEVWEELRPSLDEAIKAAIRHVTYNGVTTQPALSSWDRAKRNFLNHPSIKVLYASSVR